MPLSAWMRSTIVALRSMSSLWKRRNTASRFFTGHCDQSAWARRAAAYAAAMSSALDCGSGVITSPV